MLSITKKDINTERDHGITIPLPLLPSFVCPHHLPQEMQKLLMQSTSKTKNSLRKT